MKMSIVIKPQNEVPLKLNNFTAVSCANVSPLPLVAGQRSPGQYGRHAQHDGGAAARSWEPWQPRQPGDGILHAGPRPARHVRASDEPGN